MERVDWRLDSISTRSMLTTSVMVLTEMVRSVFAVMIPFNVRPSFSSKILIWKSAFTTALGVMMFSRR